MNCLLCQKEIDAYLEGTINSDLKDQIDNHLRGCKECSDFYRIQMLAERVISEEKQVQVNPFLSTRVMAKIEKLETGTITTSPGLLRPAFITISLAAAVFLGVIMGSIPRHRSDRETIPVELALIDDSRLESLDLLSNE